MRLSPRGELTVHHHARDPDALLTARLPNGVKTGTEQQLAEHLLDAPLRDAGAVVFRLELDDVLLVIDFRHLHSNIGQDTCFLTRIQGVVNGFLHRGDKGANERIKAEKVFVFLKKF